MFLSFIAILKVYYIIRSSFEVCCFNRLQDEVDCSLCSSSESKTNALSNSSAIIQSFGLDGAQQEAVLSCIATKECVHRNTVKLIWGPPGTGKTKTVASLLYVLLKMKCRTLTCAPTNIAVLGVTKRLMQHVRDGLEFDTYGLGDIIYLVMQKE